MHVLPSNDSDMAGNTLVKYKEGFVLSVVAVSISEH